MHSGTRPLLKPRILIASIDYDDCIAILLDVGSKKRRIEAAALQAHLIDEIVSGNYQQAILMLGSRRQHPEGAKDPFNALEKLRADIQEKVSVSCLLDTYLLFDAYNKYARHLPADPFKIAMAYLQLHKKASEYQDADIHYHFYDDRSDILHDLSAFYAKENTLVPYNTVMRFYQYAGNTADFLYTLQGSGVIDFYFDQNTCFMAKCAEYTSHSSSDISNIQESGPLYRFKTGRQLSPQDICFELQVEIQSLEKLSHHGYDKEMYAHFVQSLCVLQRGLTLDIHQQEKNNYLLEEILNSETAHIARETHYMLLQFKAENIRSIPYDRDDRWINEQRRDALLTYPNKCLPSTHLMQMAFTALIISSGFLLTQCCKPIGEMWSAWEMNMSTLMRGSLPASRLVLGAGLGMLAKQAANFLFFRPNEAAKSIGVIKGDLQKIMQADELALAKKGKFAM